MIKTRSVDIDAASAIGRAVDKLSPRGKKPIVKKASPVKKAAEPKRETTAKTGSTKKVSKEKRTSSKTDPIMSGPKATHARDVDTGKPVKLDASSQKAVSSFYGRQMKSPYVSSQNSSSVNLESPEFTPAAPKVPVKNPRKK